MKKISISQRSIEKYNSLSKSRSFISPECVVLFQILKFKSKKKISSGFNSKDAYAKTLVSLILLLEKYKLVKMVNQKISGDKMSEGDSFFRFMNDIFNDSFSDKEMTHLVDGAIFDCHLLVSDFILDGSLIAEPL